jgi:hypothetical protein
MPVFRDISDGAERAGYAGALQFVQASYRGEKGVQPLFPECPEGMSVGGQDTS